MGINANIIKLINYPNLEFGNIVPFDSKYNVFSLSETLSKKFDYCISVVDMIDSANMFISTEQENFSKCFQFFLKLTSPIIDEFQNRSEIAIEVDQ